MLTQNPSEPLTPQGRPTNYQCGAAAYTHQGAPILLGTHAAGSPRLALRWLQQRTEHITDQLDPPHAQSGRHWLTDEAEHERALGHLAAGTAYQLTLHDEDTRYILVASPAGTER